MGTIITQIEICDECQKEFDVNTVNAYDEDFQKWFCSDECVVSYSNSRARDERDADEARRDEHYDFEYRARRNGDYDYD